MTGIKIRSDVDVDLIDSMGGDDSIVVAARVSTLGAQVKESGNSAGLINFLMKNRHGTPFEHNAMTFRISAPLFVFYEFHRHRAGWSYNEESGRYRELEPVFYMPGPDRKLRQVGKPGAYTFEKGSYLQQTKSSGTHWRIALRAWEEYQALLEAGIAREVARNVLPVSVYKTQYATANLRSLMHFLSLRRTHPSATVPSYPLREIEMVAEAMEELARPLFPLAFDSYDLQGRVAP